MFANGPRVQAIHSLFARLEPDNLVLQSVCRSFGRLDRATEYLLTHYVMFIGLGLVAWILSLIPRKELIPSSDGSHVFSTTKTFAPRACNAVSDELNFPTSRDRRVEATERYKGLVPDARSAKLNCWDFSVFSLSLQHSASADWATVLAGVFTQGATHGRESCVVEFQILWRVSHQAANASWLTTTNTR